jgi:GntR family transcriptional regulator/MocR family aminotransferase
LGLRRGPVDLLVELDRDGGITLGTQLERILRTAIRDGRLPSGAALPSSRSLAGDLGISRGVVTSAYGQLAAEGYLESRQGAPVRVAAGVRAHSARPDAPSLHAEYAYDFTPGVPDLVGFPRNRWLRSVRSAWQESSLTAVGYNDPRGVPRLREALADYLGRVRGGSADPEHVLVCTGFRQGLALTCRWLRDSGLEALAIEEPGWHAARLIAEQAGLAVVPVAVDAEGIDVAALRASGADAVLVTPAHQFPTGAVLSPRRRSALLAWAEDGDRLIIEDDYDTELCRDRVGALQGLAPDRVLYVGSASKRLTPGMRLGWMLPPSWMSWSLISAKAIEDAGSEVAGQLALADFIVRGEFERHLRRMRLRYVRRREALLAALDRALPEWEAAGSGSGLHLAVRLPEGVDEPRLVTAAMRRGVGIEPLSLHSYTGECAPGLVLGYAAMAEPAIARGVELLAQALGAG